MLRSSFVIFRYFLIQFYDHCIKNANLLTADFLALSYHNFNSISIIHNIDALVRYGIFSDLYKIKEILCDHHANVQRISSLTPL